MDQTPHFWQKRLGKLQFSALKTMQKYSWIFSKNWDVLNIYFGTRFGKILNRDAMNIIFFAYNAKTYFKLPIRKNFQKSFKNPRFILLFAKIIATFDDVKYILFLLIRLRLNRKSKLIILIINFF